MANSTTALLLQTMIRNTLRKELCKLSPGRFFFSFIDVYLGILIHCRNRIQMSNNGHIHPPLPCKELA